MKPSTFSASSLQVAELCLSRYWAEYIERGRAESGDAAIVGTICHAALENFVRAIFIKKTDSWNIGLMMRLFDAAFLEIAGPDNSLPERAEAWQILEQWVYSTERREMLESSRVLSLEAKNTFPVKVRNEHGALVEFPVNYIMDRAERLDDGEYRVVDYKSNRVPLNAEQLRGKIQARLYALALQILYKDAKRIWVQFDFLRHHPVEIAFTREDQAETYRMIQRAAQRILDTSDRDAQKSETINAECGFCVRKHSCGALQRHKTVGGIHSLSVGDAAVLLDEIQSRRKAYASMEDELKDFLLMQLISQETLDLEDGGARVQLHMGSRRYVDQEALLEALGPTLMAVVGNPTIGRIEAMIKSGEIPPVLEGRARAAILTRTSEPTVRVHIKK